MLIEERIGKIWMEMLEVETFDVDIDFFDLNGNSLQAMKLIFEVNEAFSVEIEMDDFYENPTIGYLCRTIENKQSQGINVSAIPE